MATRRFHVVGSTGWLNYGHTTSMTKQVQHHMAVVRADLPNEKRLRDMQRKGMNLIRIRVEFLKQFD